MPNPYIDSLKIAKELEGKAKEFQERKKKIQKNVEEAAELCDKLEQFGISVTEEKSNLKEVSAAIDKKDIDGAQKKYADIRDSLERAWIKYYTTDYKREMDEIIQSLGKGYEKYTGDLAYKENGIELSSGTLAKIQNGITVLGRLVRQRIGSETKKGDKLDLEALYEDSQTIATMRQETNEKIKEILARVSPVELYAIKYKVNVGPLEKKKKEATQLFKEDEFNKTLELLGQYEKAITESISNKIEERISYIKSKIKEAEEIEVEVEEFKNSLASIESVKNSTDIMQMSDNIRRIEQGIERKMFDDTVQKLSKTNSALKETFGDDIPEGFKENVNSIREAIKQNDLKAAFNHIRNVTKELEDLKASQSDLRKKIDSISVTIRSAMLNPEEANSLLEEGVKILSANIISKDKVENFEAKVNRRIEKQVDAYISEIRDSHATIKRFNGKTEFIPSLNFKKKDAETLQELLDIKTQIAEEFRRITAVFNEKLSALEVDYRCKMESSELPIMMSDLNQCSGEYDKIAKEKFEILRGQLVDLSGKFAVIGLEYSSVNSIIEDSKGIPEKNIEKLLSRITRAIGYYDERTRTILENTLNIIPPQIEDYEDVPVIDLIQPALTNLAEVNKIIQGKRDTIKRKFGNQLLERLALVPRQETETELPDLEKLDYDSVMKEKLRLVGTQISTLNWFSRYNKNGGGLFSSYRDLKQNVMNLSTGLVSDFIGGVVTNEEVKNAICLRNINFHEMDTSGKLDEKKLARISEERLVNDLLHFYGVQSIKARALDELDFLVKERIVGLMREVRMNTSDDITIYKLKKIDQAKNTDVQEAFLSIIETYDRTVEKNFMKRETSRIINTIRPVILECSSELPGFIGEYRNVVNTIMTGNYKKGLKELYALISRGSGDINYARFLRDRVEHLNADNRYLTEEEKKKLEMMKNLILESRFRDATPLEFELEAVIEKAKKESAMKEYKDLTNVISAALLVNLLNVNKCGNPERMDSPKEMTDELFNKLVMAQFGGMNDVLEALEMKIDGSELRAENILETGYVIFNLRTNLMLKLNERFNELLDFMTKDSSLTVMTPAFRNHLKMVEEIESKDKLAEIFAAAKDSAAELRKQLRDWAKDAIGKEEQKIGESEPKIINSFVKSIENYESELELRTPFLYSRQEIEKRIQDLEKIGLKQDINPDNAEAAVSMLETISANLKNSVTISWEKGKEEHHFVIKATVRNDGEAPLYDSVMHFGGETHRMDRLMPGESKNVTLAYSNDHEEVMSFTSSTLGWKDFMKSVRIPPVLKYEIYSEERRESCRFCRGIIIKGVEALKCEYCGSTYHLKCAQRVKKCSSCGMDFGF